MQLATKFSAPFLAMALLLTLTGCAGFIPQAPVDQSGARAALPEKPDATDSVRGAGEPAVVTLPIGQKLLQERLVAAGDPLPNNIRIPTTNFNGIPVATALQAVLADTNISLTWQQGDFDDRLVTILNLSGPLDKVVTRICAAARVYCTYRNNTLELLEKETFVIEMPPIPSEAGNSIAEAIGKLTGEDVTEDAQGGNIIYTADTAGNQRVQEYLSQLRRGRPLIVMQVYIWEVLLDQSTNTGIRWNASQLTSLTRGGTDINILNSFGTNMAATAAGVAAAGQSGGANFGATFSGALDAAAVLSFLQSNGAVQTISNPQLTFVSGTKAEFTIGGKESYISGVGQLVGSSVSSSTPGTGTGTGGLGETTVQTEEIETGLTMKMNGAYEGGVVFGQLEIEDISLLGFTRVPSSGTEIQLPRTQNRELKTVLRLRPGDTLLLAGLRGSTDRDNVEGLPGGGLFDVLPFNKTNVVQNRELVIMLRPSIIRFSDDEALAAAAGDEAPVAADAPPEQLVEIPAAMAEPAMPTPTARPIAGTAMNDDGSISTNSLQQTMQDVMRRNIGGGVR